jgi:hypothetical protein
MSNVADPSAVFAFSITFCAVPTAETLAINSALVDPGATVTVAGTATVVLLLDTPTLNPPVVAGALRKTLHVSFTIPLTDALLHESELNRGTITVCALDANPPDSASA